MSDIYLQIIGLFVALNSLTNVLYLFMFSGLTKRIERIENIFLKDIEQLISNKINNKRNE
jgi:hypothetical protein